jgi:hypothetical protein
MNDQHPIPFCGFFFLAGLAVAGSLGAMLGLGPFFAGLLVGAVLGGIVEVLLAPLRPDVQSLLEHEP